MVETTSWSKPKFRPRLSHKSETMGKLCTLKWKRILNIDIRPCLRNWSQISPHLFGLWKNISCCWTDFRSTLNAVTGYKKPKFYSKIGQQGKYVPSFTNCNTERDLKPLCKRKLLRWLENAHQWEAYTDLNTLYIFSINLNL